MHHQSSNLLAFPLPPTACYDQSSVDPDVCRLTKLPPRSNSIPFSLRSVVLNMSTLQSSIQQSSSSEFGLFSSHQRRAIESELNQISFPQRCHSQFETEHFVSPIELKSRPVHQLETLHEKYSSMDSKTRSSALVSRPSITDRPRPIARGGSRGFLNRVEDLGYLIPSKHDHSTKRHRTNNRMSSNSAASRRGKSRSFSNHSSIFNQLMTYKYDRPTTAVMNRRNAMAYQETISNSRYSDSSESPYGRSQSLPSHVTGFDQSESSHRISNIQPRNSHINAPQSLLHLFSQPTFVSDGDVDSKPLPRHGIWSLRGARSSAGTHGSFIASLAKLDPDKTSLNLDLKLPDEKDLTETKSYVRSGHSGSSASKIFNCVLKKRNKLKKSSRTTRSQPAIDYEGRLDSLDKVDSNSNSTLSRSLNNSKHYGSVSPTPQFEHEKSVFNTLCDGKKCTDSMHRLRKIFSLRRYYDKFRSVRFTRSPDEQQLQRNKRKPIFMASVYEPGQLIF